MKRRRRGGSEDSYGAGLTEAEAVKVDSGPGGTTMGSHNGSNSGF